MSERKDVLDRDIEYFEAHREELLQKYPGKVLLIHEETIIGVFDSEEEAYRKGVEVFGNQPFLIKRVIPKQDEVIAAFPALFLGLSYAAF